MKEKWRLKKHIYCIFGTLLVAIIITMSIMQMSEAYTNANEEAKQYIEINAELGTEKIARWIDEKKLLVSMLASEVEIVNLVNNLDQLQSYLIEQSTIIENVMAIYMGKSNGEYVDSTGWVPDKEFNVLERPWYIGGSESEDVYISEPYLDVQSGKMVVSLSKKITKKGIVEAVIGMDVTVEALQHVIQGLQDEEGGYAILITENGEIVTHPKDEYEPTVGNILNIGNVGDYSKVIQHQENSIEIIKSESGDYVYSQLKSIPDTSLNLIVNYPIKHMINEVIYLVVKCIIRIILWLGICTIVVSRFVKKFISPIEDIVEQLEKISDGDLRSDMSYISKSSYELDVLVEGISSFYKTSINYIEDIKEVLYQFSQGKLTVVPQQDYIGDFLPIKEALIHIIDKINSTMINISTSAGEVSNGAEEIAHGATSLAQGATEQASIIEEFISSTEEIAETINATVEKVNKTSKISSEAKEKADKGMTVMEEMLVSMNDISTSSQEISKVLKAIDDIASQTNLLALNASIESARAGEAGRGFAVVANEIRELANRSSKTVKEIEDIIQISLENIERGQEMVNHTAEALEEITISVGNTMQITSELLEDNNHQRDVVEELVKGTKQITAIVESNSSASQESAAISEELSAQAENLKGLIDYFELKI
ncbi:methyl-accepting chemotaxis protein [Anaerosporobacter sp.]